MIFVTVGTHEQPFNRLLIKIDQLLQQGVISEEVFAQTGYSTYHPKNMISKQFLTSSEMATYMKKASIVITHGGPASFLQALQNNKIPIVVPRKSIFNEHVNDHQVEFCHVVYEKYRNILVIDDINDLSNAITNYPRCIETLDSQTLRNNLKFVNTFSELVDNLMYLS